jgi:hypothetical protein
MIYVNYETTAGETRTDALDSGRSWEMIPAGSTVVFDKQGLPIAEYSRVISVVRKAA